MTDGPCPLPRSTHSIQCATFLVESRANSATAIVQGLVLPVASVHEYPCWQAALADCVHAP